jgi:hypothetical protein
MFNKPEDARMTREESEQYGRKIDAKNARYENVELESDTNTITSSQLGSSLTEEEIVKRVGEQNYRNMNDDKTSASINS